MTRRSTTSRLRTVAATLLLAAAGASVTLLAAAPPPAPRPASAPTTNPVKQLLAAELNQVERDIAARMLRRPDLPPARRGRLELEIDLRILQRSVINAAADAKFDTPEQAHAWIRAKQFHDALRDFEDARAQETNALTPSQQEAIGQLHKLSYTPGGASDEFCRTVALAMVNSVNTAPVAAPSLPAMRPRPLPAAQQAPADRAPTLAELSDEVHRLAAISVPLRQQLLALAATAGAEKDDKTVTQLLTQSVELARGLQSNTAVGPEARLGIESQLAEGIALYADPRTRDAGKARVDALAQYRQTLTRIDKLGLSREQLEQLAPAFTYAQSTPGTGPKLLATVEQFFDAAARWDALPNNVVSLPTNLRRPLEDLRAQFTRTRAAFLQDASRVGTPGGPSPAVLDAHLDDANRLVAVADDLLAAPASLDTLNNLKPRPAGAMEKRLATAAQAAAAPIFAATRTDGQKYLDAVHTLATLVRDLSSKNVSDVPAPVLQAWSGNRLDAFERRWRAHALDLASTLAGGSTDLEPAKIARLHTATKLLDALHTAADLEAAQPKLPALARWADWSIEPAAVSVVFAPYREATAAAFSAFISDTADPLDKWQRLQPRYQPLIALILRDAAYAEQCQSFPIGLAADAARLATAFDNAPFATERYASYAITLWALFERAGDYAEVDRISTALARRLARDLKLDLPATRPVDRKRP